MKRKRFKDVHNPEGEAKLSKFVPGEAAMDRHARRLGENLNARHVAKEWAEKNGLHLTVTNHGHHWSFYEFDAVEGDPQLFEWLLPHYNHEYGSDSSLPHP